MSRLLEQQWYGASMVMDSLGGTAVPYEKVMRLGSAEEWITWDLMEPRVSAWLYNGGQSCEMEALLISDGLNCLNLCYSEVGKLEEASMSMVALLGITGKPELMEIAEVLKSDGYDIMITVEPETGDAFIVWQDEDGDLDDPMEGNIGEDSHAFMTLELPNGKELSVVMNMDNSRVQVSFESMGEDVPTSWEIVLNRLVDAGLIADIKSPGAASDFLFGELMTMPVTC